MNNLYKRYEVAALAASAVFTQYKQNYGIPKLNLVVLLFLVLEDLYIPFTV